MIIDIGTHTCNSYVSHLVGSLLPPYLSSHLSTHLNIRKSNICICGQISWILPLLGSYHITRNTHYSLLVFVIVPCFSLCLAAHWLCLCHTLSGGVMSYHSAMFCHHNGASAVDLALTRERRAKSGWITRIITISKFGNRTLLPGKSYISYVSFSTSWSLCMFCRIYLMFFFTVSAWKH